MLMRGRWGRTEGARRQGDPARAGTSGQGRDVGGATPLQ